ncbi:rhodanese-like/PpiC domain-containing protein 12, chloroplastic [Lolium perenne]|uniref:rhodanese-like/PpiC domain-containing protein 12, chloroplastic n=1 Tax=Lolium perenne TaxID=4522 RepID=UPI0021EAA914|nr:rhodanese-like/PpiC domain-containing protein 12, chloroplastic [Lolium perenne]
MLGLRATRAARFPCPYSPSSSSSQAASLSGFARLAPLAAGSPAPPPAALSLLASARPISATWGSAMRPAGQPRPSTRVLCTAAGSAQTPREGKEVLVQHLLVGEKDARLLVDLEKSIASGVDLSDLAVEHSLCPSKDNGGMLGWVRRGQMVPEFEEAAFSAPLKKVVRCKTKFGWHLVQVLSERDQCMLQDIAPEELHAKMQDPSFIEEAQLIDVREPDEVERASLPGFKVLPLRQFGTWGPVMADEYDPQKDTYVLCHHGMRSMQVAKWLQSQGFQKIYNVAGGIHAYSVKADSSIPTY